MASPANDPYRSTSVERAFELVDRVAAAGRDGVTLAQLAADVPTAKSTTHRYVATLLGLGVLRRDAAGRLFLGLKLIELAGAMLGGDNLRAVAEPVLHELVARTGETVHLGVPSDGQVVYIAKVESPHSIRLVSRIGARAPYHSSAMGKAILSCMDAESLEAALERPRAVRTPHTITDRDALLAELERIREQGYSLDAEENEAGVRCVGAPVRGTGGRAVAAISVSGPATRMTPEHCEEIAPAIVAGAQQIARALGNHAL